MAMPATKNFLSRRHIGNKSGYEYSLVLVSSLPGKTTLNDTVLKKQILTRSGVRTHADNTSIGT